MPVPQVRDFEELNGFLRQRCEEDRQRRLRGQRGEQQGGEEGAFHVPGS